MDEILQLSPIREGKLQEDLQTMLISNEKKVTMHSKINFSCLRTYKLLHTSDVVRRNAQWNLTLTSNKHFPELPESSFQRNFNLPTRSLKTVPLSINFAHLALNHFHIRRKKIEYMINKLFLLNSKS